MLRGISLLLVTFALTAQAVVERTVAKTFAVPPEAKIFLDTFFGNVSVIRSESRELTVTVDQTIEADDDRGADEVLKLIKLEMTQQGGGDVSVRCVFNRAFRWSWEKWPPIGLDWTLEVPDHCNLDLISREGGFTLGKHRGNVRVRTLQGTVFMGETQGAVEAETQGDFSLTSCTGPLTAKTRGGNILVGRVGGAARISGGGGAVDIKMVGSSLVARWDGEELKVGFPYPVAAAAELVNDGGDIIVTLDPRSRVRLEADAGVFGKVRLRGLPSLEEAVNSSTRKFNGILNEDGPPIQMRSGGGNIRISGVPSLP